MDHKTNGDAELSPKEILRIIAANNLYYFVQALLFDHKRGNGEIEETIDISSDEHNSV